MGRLDGKVALISGGAKGQGAVEGRMLAREGAAVVLGDVSTTRARRSRPKSGRLAARPPTCT